MHREHMQDAFEQRHAFFVDADMAGFGLFADAKLTDQTHPAQAVSSSRSSQACHFFLRSWRSGCGSSAEWSTHTSSSLQGRQNNKQICVGAAQQQQERVSANRRVVH